jgi:hypothetical protein
MKKRQEALESLRTRMMMAMEATLLGISKANFGMLERAELALLRVIEGMGFKVMVRRSEVVLDVLVLASRRL